MFLWQKQIQSYEFSLDKERQALGGLKEAAKDFESNLPPFEVPDEFLKELEQYRIEKYGTTTPEFATSTDEEAHDEAAELKALFEKLGP